MLAPRPEGLGLLKKSLQNTLLCLLWDFYKIVSREIIKIKKARFESAPTKIVKYIYLRLMSAQVVVNLPVASTAVKGRTSSKKLCLSVASLG